jgi:hypothetical protein
MPRHTDSRTLLLLKSRHDELITDRRGGAGRLGDQELTRLLLSAYPTLEGQRN